MEEDLLPEEKKTPVPSKKKKKKQREQLRVISNRCKNCDTLLNLDQAFCSNCGAKRMYNRLNWRNLTEDFVDRFLNIENNFLRTFLALFKRPEDVIGGYIDGMRKRYLSAFSYFAISLTITGLYTFVLRKWFLNEAMFEAAAKESNGEVVVNTIGPTMEIVNWVFEYQSILTFINIPLYALISILVFWNYKKYNFIEHVVIYLYVYSHTQIITSVISILFMWSSFIQVMISSLVTFLYIIYTAYVLKRLFNLTIEKILLKTLLFFAIGLVISIAFFGVGGWLLYELGVFDTFIEKIDQMREAQKAAKAAKETSKAITDSLQIDSIKQLSKSIKDTVLLLGS
ncbi:hypothetical protein GCM10011344_44110 [Dokdonia pacifica]|uniref:DUF3667 domain-containing protein n=1 Tax=Dokdonia pacifica TaxID=1627892 RepID=A0A239CJ69_9FLAO|nr:DUF3667 domain-containing protein [Dokdonia pacifica]GGG38408.1 hypothetical protein GCM10011344_44110 [Dokdonia pacifica]SNS20276.1 Protein of unknown function [Dokdonia pacifica]